jgi:hypothetical protein
MGVRQIGHRGVHDSVAEVEELRERIGRLVCERQALRTAGASRASLERNRVRLAWSQSQLSHALIACHLAA